MELAIDHSDAAGRSHLFFTRDTNRCYLTDADGALTEIPLRLKNGYNILFALADGEDVFLTLQKDTEGGMDTRSYFLKKSDLDGVVFD